MDKQSVCGTEYTSAQLRLWLRKLGLPSTGTKSALLVRLNDIPCETRGQCPVLENEADDMVFIESVEKIGVGEYRGKQSECCLGENDGANDRELSNDCEVQNDRELQYDSEFENNFELQNDRDLQNDSRPTCSGANEKGVQSPRPHNADNIFGRNLVSVLNRELEIIKREKELLRKENEILKMMREVQRRNETVEIMTNEKNHKEVEKEGLTQSSDRTSVSFGLLKEMILEYDGENFPEIWVSQFKNINSMYKTDEGTMKTLLMCKLKGRAQAWLYSKPNFMYEVTEKILLELEENFSTKENKLILRKNFEARRWRYNESFIQYYEEKVLLSNKVGIEEDELIEYIIEGIPDNQLRIQASLQCYTSKTQLLQAFSKIQLNTMQKGQKRLDQAQGGNVNNFRCFNCNSVGHFAASCQKPKRQMGACYGCGKLDHQVASCPERKPAVHLVDNSEYVRYFKFSLYNNFDNEFSLECLIDSGSVVSFVRRSSILKFVELRDLLYTDENFFGINWSKLDIYGKFKCFVSVGDGAVELDMLVVSDDTTSYECVLGRDFLLKGGFRLVSQDTKGKVNSGKDFCRQIRSIDSGPVLEGGFGSDSKGQLEHMDGDEDFCRRILSVDVGEASDFDLVIGDGIGLVEKDRLRDIYYDYYVRPVRPPRPSVYSEIKLRLSDDKCFNCGPRRLSYAERTELQILLDRYLEKGYIRPSESEYASPIVLVRKKTGDLRMCVDFRTLNKITVRDNYPIPLIDDLLDRLSGRRIFTKLDLRDGFFHVFVHPDSVKYTSFVTPLGQFEFLRMPFGLKNAPSVFQRFVNRVFADMVRDGKVIIYLDDIMIATVEVQEHFEILKEVFTRLVENNLDLRIDKCEFFQTSVKYLGYTIDGDGIRADDKGLRAIRDFPVPDKPHSVQSFLGLCSYFRRFVKDFSILAKPLYDLTRKDRKFCFGKIELEAFEVLKAKLMESPVLALFDPRDETELHCDASSVGFGAVLLQKKGDGKFHPVFYFSKRTTDTESKYHSFELETLAIIYALRRFRIYLQGRRFKIVTDCNSLTMTLSKKELNPRISRWALELQNFDYVLEHRSGNRMQHVDALSRCTNVMVIGKNTFEENLIICQNRDSKLGELRNDLQKSEHSLYEMRNGLVYRKANDGNLLFYVPGEMEAHVLYKYHNEMGHIGIDKVSELILKSYWFPNMRAKIMTHIDNCMNCIAYSEKHGKGEGFLHSIPKPEVPFDTIHIDHFGPVDNGRAMKHVLVIVDACTKFVRLYPARTTCSREAIMALRDYFRAYSRPRQIISDRGTCFTSKDFSEFMKENNVRHVLVATGSPQANGQVERVNRSLGPMLAKLVDPQRGIFWDRVLEQVEFSLNNSIHRSIGQHPSVVLFGVGQRGKVVDLLREYLTGDNSGKREDLAAIRLEAADRQRKLQDYNAKYFDKRRKAPTSYKDGDYVMVRNFDSTAGVSRKLIPKYRGPYRISKVLRNDRYLLEDVEGFQQSRTPYRGVWAVSNMRPWLGGCSDLHGA